jgi:hypothetical protein
MSEILPEPEETTPASKIPMVAMAKHPCRFAIRGVTHTIPELKKVIADSDLHDGLKSYLSDELDKIQDNAAEIYLSDDERPTGGFNLHITCDPIHLGAKENGFFKRDETATK